MKNKDTYIEVGQIDPLEIMDKFGLLCTVDCVIFGYNQESLNVLTIECTTKPYVDKLSLLGDVLYREETTNEAAKRILRERAGLQNIYMEDVGVFSDIDRHPLSRVITVGYYSLVQIEDFAIVDAQNRHLTWIDVATIEEMAYDHKKILDSALIKLKKTIRQQPIGFKLLPEKFTLNQLQSFYEVVLGIKFDKRNFRRKLKSLDVLTDLGEIQDEVSHRPAKLYSFDSTAYEKRKANGGVNFTV